MKKKIWMQRVVGLILIIFSAVIIALAANGTSSMIDRDTTGVLLCAPLGVVLILSKKPVLDLLD